MLPPYFYKGVSDEGVFRYYADVIERLADSRLRLYLYHIPALTQIGFSVPLIERLRRAFPEIVVGLKDSSGDWAHTKALIAALPGFRIYAGSEVHLRATIESGGAGCISGTANVNAPLLRQIADCLEPEATQILQQRATALRKTIEAFPLIAAAKAILAHFQKEPAWQRLRAPLLPLPEADAARLVTALEREFNFSLPGSRSANA